MIINSLISIKNALPLLMQGAAITLFVWIASMAIALIFGVLWGIIRADRLRVAGLSSFFDFVTFLLRAVPFYVQLLIAYFVLPDLIGINISACTAGICALGICSAAYVSQIIRAGINAIDAGQWQAAYVLGYTSFDTIRWVIFPQAMKIILPALSGELDQLLKSSSILSAIGVLELTGAAKNVIARELNPLTMYIAIAVMYVMIASIVIRITTMLERKLSYDSY